MVAHEANKPPGDARRRWPWVVGTITVILALIVGVSIWYQSRQQSEPAAEPSPTAAASSAAAVTGESPDGCLAGTTNETSTLLAGQADAPQTEAGAISVAAAIFRWGVQYPRPTAAEGLEAQEAVVAEQPSGALTRMAENFADPEPVEGVTSFRVSFADGRYLTRSSTDERVEVTLGASQILNGREDEEKTASTFIMVWEDDSWKIQSDSSEGIDLEELYATGATFAGGC